MNEFYQEKKDKFEWGFPLVDGAKEMHINKFDAYQNKNWKLNMSVIGQ